MGEGVGDKLLAVELPLSSVIREAVGDKMLAVELPLSNVVKEAVGDKLLVVELSPASGIINGYMIIYGYLRIGY